MQLRVMEHSFGSTGGLYDENNFSAAIAALTLAFSRGCGVDFNTDDILMVALGQLSPGECSEDLRIDIIKTADNLQRGSNHIH
ncbi:hypothetical protein ACN42_g10402 [Penicillium freii]|uniref:Uncharacterized protein n=1 Tax=Penicillium freii TaxID=48697 RepID=A0A117NKY2_PENFR|nr:hypothetical protein ACN42_g10402 [Penicillium freii]